MIQNLTLNCIVGVKDVQLTNDFKTTLEHFKGSSYINTLEDVLNRTVIQLVISKGQAIVISPTMEMTAESLNNVIVDAMKKAIVEISESDPNVLFVHVHTVEHNDEEYKNHYVLPFIRDHSLKVYIKKEKEGSRTTLQEFAQASWEATQDTKDFEEVKK